MRFLRFNLVGLGGIVVQLAVIGVLAHGLGTPPWIAAAAGVAAAVLHNYAWHRRWTWADRVGRQPAWREFLAFAAANGAVSLAGNVAIVGALTRLTSLGAVTGSAIAIGVCGLANFWIADRAVFRRVSGSGNAASRHTRWSCFAARRRRAVPAP